MIARLVEALYFQRDRTERQHRAQRAGPELGIVGMTRGHGAPRGKRLLARLSGILEPPFKVEDLTQQLQRTRELGVRLNVFFVLCNDLAQQVQRLAQRWTRLGGTPLRHANTGEPVERERETPSFDSRPRSTGIANGKLTVDRHRLLVH